MKGFLVFLVIICMALLYVGAQEEAVEPIPEPALVEPISEPVTRLNVTIIDGLNDKLIKLENCIVHVRGKLHIVEDSFDYTNTFIEGDRYEITIHIKMKK